MEDTRLLDKLDDICDRLARVETTVDGLSARIDKYNNVTGRVADLEHGIKVAMSNCARIQEEKKRWRIGPVVLASVLGGTMVGVVMLVVSKLARVTCLKTFSTYTQTGARENYSRRGAVMDMEGITMLKPSASSRPPLLSVHPSHCALQREAYRILAN